MNPTSFMKEIPKGSPSYQRRNPELFRDQTPINLHGKWGFKVGELEPDLAQLKAGSMGKPPRRIRQSSKPLLNKLEQDYFNHLELFRADGCHSKIYPQAMTFRLANGLRFTVDLFAFDWPDIGELNRPTAFEVKGPWFTDDANAKLKMFAHQYPEIRVILAWRNGIFWQTQRILA